MTPIPFLLVGDGPQEHTGLGRIARDIGTILVSQVDAIDLLQVGGPVPPVWTAWPHVPMGAAERGDDWGASFVTELWRDRWDDEPGVLMAVWDPARCYAYLDSPLNVQKWGYMAIDAANINGGLSGPPGTAVWKFDRVLAYGRWASTVMKTAREGPVSYLPHGLWLDTYREASELEAKWAMTQLGPYYGSGSVLVGCVATNHARKDLSLFFEALALLNQRGQRAYGWLHTDNLIGAWSVSQLIEDTGMQKRITVSLGRMSDRQLACMYQRCDVTIAPGLGEGFGYPIVESLASGVPVVHGDYGGGAELVPRNEWRVPVRERRRESVYALTRPVFRAEDFANAVERVLLWRDQVGLQTAAAYCRGAVAHLDWNALTPRWASWIREGLK